MNSSSSASIVGHKRAKRERNHRVVADCTHTLSDWLSLISRLLLPHRVPGTSTGRQTPTVLPIYISRESAAAAVHCRPKDHWPVVCPKVAQEKVVVVVVVAVVVAKSTTTKKSTSSASSTQLNSASQSVCLVPLCPLLVTCTHTHSSFPFAALVTIFNLNYSTDRQTVQSTVQSRAER